MKRLKYIRTALQSEATETLRAERTLSLGVEPIATHLALAPLQRVSTSGSARLSSAQLSTVKLVMETQIGAARFHGFWRSQECEMKSPITSSNLRTMLQVLDTPSQQKSTNVSFTLPTRV